MVEKTEQSFRTIGKTQEMRGNEVFDKCQDTHQTNPIARKLLDFSIANKTHRFSVKDLFK